MKTKAGSVVLLIFILNMIRRTCVPTVDLRRRICLTYMRSRLVQRRLHWLNNVVRCRDDDLIREPTLLIPPRAGANELEAPGDVIVVVATRRLELTRMAPYNSAW